MGWTIAAVWAGAGCIPAPVLRARDAGSDALDVTAVDAGVTDAADVGVADVSESGVPDAEVLPAPRPTRPLSFAVVGSAQPELRWVLPERATGAQVQLCEDRDCMRIEQTIDAQGNLARVSTVLRRGAHFWRVRARYGAESSPWSVTWEFLVQGGSNSMVSWYGFTDFDRDGVADIVVGAPEANGGRGAVLVYRGKMNPATEPLLTFLPPEPMLTRFGAVVSAGGDVDGDGRMDILAFSEQGPQPRISVLREVGDELRVDPRQTIRGEIGGFFSPAAVTFAGDVNGDGYGDVVLGSARVRESTGEVLVYLGSAQGLSDTRYVIVRPPVAGMLFGARVMSIGDQNADRFDDLVISDVIPGIVGGIYLVRGSSNFVSQGIEVSALDVQSSEAPGEGGAALGDVDYDGRADFAMSARSGVGLLYRSTGTSGAITSTSLNSMNVGCYKIGLVYAGGFDLTGDGMPDYSIRCEFEVGRYEIAVFEGGPMHPARSNSVVRRSMADSSRFAADLGSYGDFDGDGIGDVVATTPSGDSTPTELSVFLGTMTRGSWRSIALRLPAGFGLMDRLALSH